MLRRLLREKLLTEKFLHHSELNRSLNIPFTVAIVCASSIPLLIFVLMPYSLTTLAGPSTILAVLLTFVIVLLSSAHLTELSCALPKSCVLYQFTFVMLGELPAFFGAWTTVLDSVCISTILCSSWSEHMNLLFRRSLHYYMSLPIPQRDSGMWVVNETYDFTALCAVFVTVIILSCNLRVVGTVSLCLVIVSVLMTTSCTMVGFFHADPQNWINASFFGFGFRGVLRAICALSCAYAGVDATSYLFDETKSPRKNLPVLLPTLVAFLSIFFFIITMIFSLSTDVSKLPQKILLPEMLSVLNIQAVKSHHEAGFNRMRYILTISAVCGLSGAVLSSFLPGSRMIDALSRDRLLPLPADMTRRPVISVFFFSIMVSFALLIHRDVLLQIVFFTSPLKMIITVSLVFLQHYRSEPIGMPHETSHYKSIRKKQVSITEDSSSTITNTFSQYDTDSATTVDTSVYLQMAIAKHETLRHQRRLEKKLDQYILEKIPVMAKSVSHYNTMDPVTNSSNIHNCIADSCSMRDTGGEIQNYVHLYSQELPELPYVETFNARRPLTPTDSNKEFKKAKRVLVLFLIFTVLFSQIAVVFGFETVSSSVLLSLLFSVMIFSIILGNQLTTNDYLPRRQAKVPGFPYLSYVTLFTLIFALATTKLFVYGFYFLWLFIGLLLYFTYGFWNSSVRYSSQVRNSTDDTSDAYRAIIGDDYTSQLE
ncbi:hypothetical protein Angca_003969 [Angiostrongylus cantonensis]|nr:hypothetical protein Angca_003969 [Angiostrongylus cantonensis]